MRFSIFAMSLCCTLGAPLQGPDGASTLQAGELSELAQLKSKGILTDAQFMAAMKGLIDSAQAGPFSSGQGVRQSVAPFGGTDLERYGISGLPSKGPASTAAQAADAVAVHEMEGDEDTPKDTKPGPSLANSTGRTDAKEPDAPPAAKKDGATDEEGEDGEGGEGGEEGEEEEGPEVQKHVLIENKYQDNTDENLLSPDFINIDYMAQGYNIFYGNPLPMQAGVDPGYTDHAGEQIWELAYEHGRTTGLSDGAYNLPDGLYVKHDTGCKLSYSAASMTSQKEYQEELAISASVSAGFDTGFTAGEFSASADYQKAEETNEARSTQTIISKAECVKFHATLPDFEDRPQFTKGFKKAVFVAMQAPAVGKEETLWRMFDTFGTHFPTMLRFGSRFGMFTQISSKEASKFGSMSASATIAVSLNKELEEEQKCPAECGEEKEAPEAAEASDVSPGSQNNKNEPAKKPKKKPKRSLERLTRSQSGVEGVALRRGHARHKLAPQAGEGGAGDGFASLLEVQAGRKHGTHAAARAQRFAFHSRSKQAAAELEASEPVEAHASHAPMPARGDRKSVV